MSSAITIPNRFESLQAEFNEYRPLIVPIEEDLKAYMRLRERARLQNGGLLCFLLGPSGIGKTTSAHSAVVNAPEIFTRVVLVPHEVDFREPAYPRHSVKISSRYGIGAVRTAA